MEKPNDINRYILSTHKELGRFTTKLRCYVYERTAFYNDYERIGVRYLEYGPLQEEYIYAFSLAQKIVSAVQRGRNFKDAMYLNQLYPERLIAHSVNDFIDGVISRPITVCDGIGIYYKLFEFCRAVVYEVEEIIPSDVSYQDLLVVGSLGDNIVVAV